MRRFSDLTNGLSAKTTSSQGGWMAGGGIEWAFQFIGLNGFSVAPTFVADRFVVNNPTVTFGINYLFH
jgi:hypothetical protein